MKVVRYFALLTLILSAAVLGGCKNEEPAKEGEYDIKGKVVSVADDKTSVTLDHEEIPGLMKAMNGMKYKVESKKVLEGISAGDQVKGRLAVKGGEQFITKLEKTSAGGGSEDSKEEAEIKANLAKLSTEDRKVAEAQKFCPMTDERLGDMGVPIKVMVKDEPVFLCCGMCKKKALDEADTTLGKVNELKKKNAPPK
jgi:Cu/Ag efflux protein CusF